MEEPSEMRQELMNRVENVMNKACDYRNSFDGYTYLWVDDRQEFMRQVTRLGDSSESERKNKINSTDNRNKVIIFLQCSLVQSQLRFTANLVIV